MRSGSSSESTPRLFPGENSEGGIIVKLRAYLEAERDIVAKCCSEDLRYKGMADAILKHGLYQETIPPVPDWLHTGERGFCYQNATRSATNHVNLRYVEGYAMFHGIPLAHAWVYDVVAGKYYDPTWKDEGTEYYGVVFDTEFILSFAFRTEHYGVWGSEQMTHLDPYMKDGFPESAFLKFEENTCREVAYENYPDV